MAICSTMSLRSPEGWTVVEGLAGSMLRASNSFGPGCVSLCISVCFLNNTFQERPGFPPNGAAWHVTLWLGFAWRPVERSNGRVHGTCLHAHPCSVYGTVPAVSAVSGDMKNYSIDTRARTSASRASGQRLLRRSPCETDRVLMRLKPLSDSDISRNLEVGGAAGGSMRHHCET